MLQKKLTKRFAYKWLSEDLFGEYSFRKSFLNKFVLRIYRKITNRLKLFTSRQFINLNFSRKVMSLFNKKFYKTYSSFVNQRAVFKNKKLFSKRYTGCIPDLNIFYKNKRQINFSRLKNLKLRRNYNFFFNVYNKDSNKLFKNVKCSVFALSKFFKVSLWYKPFKKNISNISKVYTFQRQWVKKQGSIYYYTRKYMGFVYNRDFLQKRNKKKNFFRRKFRVPNVFKMNVNFKRKKNFWRVNKRERNLVLNVHMLRYIGIANTRNSAAYLEKTKNIPLNQIGTYISLVELRLVSCLLRSGLLENGYILSNMVKRSLFLINGRVFPLNTQLMQWDCVSISKPLWWYVYARLLSFLNRQKFLLKKNTKYKPRLSFSRPSMRIIKRFTQPLKKINRKISAYRLFLKKFRLKLNKNNIKVKKLFLKIRLKDNKKKVKNLYKSITKKLLKKGKKKLPVVKNKKNKLNKKFKFKKSQENKFFLKLKKFKYKNRKTLPLKSKKNVTKSLKISKKVLTKILSKYKEIKNYFTTKDFYRILFLVKSCSICSNKRAFTNYIFLYKHFLLRRPETKKNKKLKILKPLPKFYKIAVYKKNTKKKFNKVLKERLPFVLNNLYKNSFLPVKLRKVNLKLANKLLPFKYFSSYLTAKFNYANKLAHKLSGYNNTKLKSIFLAKLGSLKKNNFRSRKIFNNVKKLKNNNFVKRFGKKHAKRKILANESFNMLKSSLLKSKAQKRRKAFFAKTFNKIKKKNNKSNKNKGKDINKLKDISLKNSKFFFKTRKKVSKKFSLKNFNLKRNKRMLSSTLSLKDYVKTKDLNFFLKSKRRNGRTFLRKKGYFFYRKKYYNNKRKLVRLKMFEIKRNFYRYRKLKKYKKLNKNIRLHRINKKLYKQQSKKSPNAMFLIHPHAPFMELSYRLFSFIIFRLPYKVTDSSIPTSFTLVNSFSRNISSKYSAVLQPFKWQPRRI